MKKQDFNLNQPVENEDDLKVDKRVLEQTTLWGTDWTIETIFNQILKGNIDLNPNFQRRNAWNLISRSKLIESLIIGLPIPQIILAEKKNEKGKYIVIDGKQRLLTIRQFLSEEDDIDFPPYKLKELPILSELNNYTFAKMKDTPAFADFVTQFENQTIRTVIVKNWQNEEFLYTIFHRLNTGSLKLNPQELRKALHPGEFIDAIDKYSADSKGIMKILDIDEPDSRMRDVELTLRYFAYKNFITEYKGNLKSFFDTTAEILNVKFKKNIAELKNEFNNLETAIESTYEIFGEVAFRKWADGAFEKRFNRAIYDIMVYYLSDEGIRKKAISSKAKVIKSFKDLCEKDEEFLQSFEFSTKSVENTFKRFTTWGKTLAKVLKIRIKVPVNINGKKSIKEY